MGERIGKNNRRCCCRQSCRICGKAERMGKWWEPAYHPASSDACKSIQKTICFIFLPEIPRDFQPLQDFRKTGAKELSTSSIFIIREIQQKQAWISNVLAENRESKLPFAGKFTINDNPKSVANDIIATLKVNPTKYKTDNPIREWIDAAGTGGIFISRTSFINSHLKLDAEELQGFAIADPYAPFVFVNSEDWNAPQLFTLAHELAHIWIAETGISNEIEPTIRTKDRMHPVELFCNEVAANALMPATLVSSLAHTTFQNAGEVFKQAKRFGVSSFALLVRARNLNLINASTYRRLKKQADIAYAAFLKHEVEKKDRQKKKEKSGGPNYYLLRLNRNSRLFTQTVLDAFNGGLIEPTLASNLLNVKVNKFQKLESQLYR